MLLAPSVLAQTAPSLEVALTPATLRVDASGNATLAGTVTYREAVPDPVGAAQATVSLALALPEGWTATMDPASSFQLAPGQSVPIEVALVAPAAGVGAQAGTLRLDASATGPAARAASASASVELARIDPVVDSPPPWYATAWGILLLVGLPLEALGLVALALHQRRARRAAAEAEAAFLARETGVAIRVVDGPRVYGSRREVMFRLEVENVSDRPRVAIVDVASVHERWRAATTVTRVPLSRGERVPVTLVATPDPTLAPGEAGRVVVRARPEEAQERDERVELAFPAPPPRIPVKR